MQNKNFETILYVGQHEAQFITVEQCTAYRVIEPIQIEPIYK